MKKATCKQLKGACDVVLTGDTADEMAENSKKHAMEMFAGGDEAHKQAMNEMMMLSQEEQQKFFEDFKNNFDSLEDA